MKPGRCFYFSGSSVLILSSVLLIAGLLSAAPESKNRQISGNANIVIGLEPNPKLSEPFDSITKKTLFVYKVTFLPPREQVQSDFLFEGTTQNGRRIALRLVRPGSGIADFQARKIDLDLVFELTLEGKKFQIPCHWTTGRIQDAFGTDEGRLTNVDLEKETADVKLVGTSRFTARAKDFAPDAPEENQLNFVIRFIMEGHLSDAQ